MTLRALDYTPKNPKAILTEFYRDVRSALGWREMCKTMEMIALLDQGSADYYLIGSRILGCNRPDSDLDILACTPAVESDFDQMGIPIYSEELAAAGTGLFLFHIGRDYKKEAEERYRDPYWVRPEDPTHGLVNHAKNWSSNMDFQLYTDPIYLEMWQRLLKEDLQPLYSHPKQVQTKKYRLLIKRILLELRSSQDQRKA